MFDPMGITTHVWVGKGLGLVSFLPLSSWGYSAWMRVCRSSPSLLSMDPKCPFQAALIPACNRDMGRDHGRI